MNSSTTNVAGKHILNLAPGCYKPRKTYNNPRKPLDWATVEAVVVQDGYITSSASVGAIHEIVQPTENIIVKGNARIPNFEDLHSIHCSSAAPNYQPCVRYYSPFTMMSPHTSPYSQDRLGPPMPIDLDYVIALIKFSTSKNAGTNAFKNDVSRAIDRFLIQTLSEEVRSGRPPTSL